jgi:predicted RNA-binding protein Jag
MSDAGGSIAESGDAKCAQAGEVLGEMLRLIGLRARVDVKDVPARDAEADRPATPASISVALHLEEVVPGIVAGKRSQIVDAVQFLANKIVNRGVEKRWINIGIGSHPEPRIPGQKPQRQSTLQAKQPARAPVAGPSGEAAPVVAPGSRPQAEARQAREKASPEAKPKRAVQTEGDESQLEVADDAAIQRLGRLLGEKSSQFGRHFGIFPMSGAERVNLERGASGVAGTTVKMEGEGRHRRVAFVPANPKPMPKRSALPDYDVEDEEDEESGD